LALAEKRLEEFRMLDDVLLHRVKANDVVEIGNFKVEFIHASHSLVDCFSLAIRTPLGTIIHTGDYKIDDTPVIGKPYDLETLRRYGDEGVLVLLADSTNATVPGRTPSEQAVIPAFREIFEETPGRLFVATFSSSIHRLQIILDLAHEYGRKVCVLGRSMQKNVEIAYEQGLLKVAHSGMISMGEARSLDDDEICYLVTGSQGENRAALWNMATSTYKGLAFRPHHSREREEHQPPHRPPLQARRKYHRREATTRPCFRACVAGRYQDHGRNFSTKISRTDSRRIPNALPP
jgi:ribonuclease J